MAVQIAPSPDHPGVRLGPIYLRFRAVGLVPIVDISRLALFEALGVLNFEGFQVVFAGIEMEPRAAVCRLIVWSGIMFLRSLSRS